jgi:hypothetical protein
MWGAKSKLESKTEWVDLSTDSIVEFARRNNLDAAILSSTQDVLILPNNATFGEPPKVHVFASSAKEILFVLRESNVNASMYQDNRRSRLLILKSELIILPQLYFVGSLTASVILNVLSNWIYDRFVKDHEGEPQPTIRYESAERTVDGSVRWRRVEGPAQEVHRVLKQEQESLQAGTVPQPQLPAPGRRKSSSKCRTNQKKTQPRASRKPKS